MVTMLVSEQKQVQGTECADSAAGWMTIYVVHIYIEKVE